MPNIGVYVINQMLFVRQNKIWKFLWRNFNKLEPSNKKTKKIKKKVLTKKEEISISSFTDGKVGSYKREWRRKEEKRIYGQHIVKNKREACILKKRNLRSNSFKSSIYRLGCRTKHRLRWEFDPGSERTLAAGLTHASWTRMLSSLLFDRKVAHWWVTRGNVPIGGEQQLETTANTA